MRSLWIRIVAVCCLGLAWPLAGCGDDDGVGQDDAGSNGNNGNDAGSSGSDGGGSVTPTLIPGGGVSSGAIAGELHVHVINGRDDTPVVGAQVRVGEPGDAAPLTATTDANGLASFVDASLSGAQTVTATSPGYAAATWFGVNGGNATLPLAPTPAPALETATVSGTIEGWDTMSKPSLPHYLAAYVSYSHTDNVLGAENRITQPVDSEDTPLNLCTWVQIFGQNPCNWQLTTRTGKQMIYAVLLDGDTNGTNQDPSDDTYEVIGYATLSGLELSAGQDLTGQVLTQMTATTDVTMTFPAAPTGLDEVVGIPYIRLGDEGRVPAYLFGPNNPTNALPDLSGPFAGASYDIYGLASPVGDDDDRVTLSLMYDVNVAGGVTLPAWLETPAGLTAASGAYSFTAVGGAQLHIATYATAAGDPKWTVMLLDNRTSFSLPTLSPDPLPTGAVDMTVTALVIPGFDPQSFANSGLADQTTQSSLTTVSFTH